MDRAGEGNLFAAHWHDDMAQTKAHKAPSHRRTRAFARLSTGLLSTLLISTVSYVAPSTARADDTPPADEDPVRADREGRYQLGPIWVSENGAARVRSNRAASKQIAYVAPPRQPDAAWVAALAAFENEVMPPHAAPQPAQTIRTEPPEAWMKKLELPDLPVRWNHELVSYLRYFKDDPNGQAMMKAWFRRKGRYESEIRRVLGEVGVPEDLIYVALAESGFRPDVRSRVGAAGLWQFMEPTGRVYGLGSDYWIDDRRDYERSTYAAAAYLEDLHVRFGSWELALAAYNAGYGLVMQSIRRHNTNNFWALCEVESGLPHATTKYVPKIIAAAIVGRNPEVFGLEKVSGVLPAQALVEVTVPPGTRIKDLAEAIEVDVDVLEEYNARYIRGRTPPDGAPAKVRIPKTAMKAFEGVGDDLRTQLQPYTTYELSWGEDLGTVATRFGITEKELRRINGVHDSAEVKGGVTLVVPREPDPSLRSDDLSVSSTRPLVAIPPIKVEDGRRLVFVRVTRALTQRELTERLGVGWAELLRWNDLDDSARLFDGLWLQALVPKRYDGKQHGIRVYETDEVVAVIRGSRQHLEAELDRRDMVRRAHKVRKGETLGRIGKKYGLSVGSLARINGFDRDHRPEPGDLVVVYVEKGKTGGTVSAPPPDETTLTAELAEVETVSEGSRAPSTAETSRLPGQKDTNK